MGGMVGMGDGMMSQQRALPEPIYPTLLRSPTMTAEERAGLAARLDGEIGQIRLDLNSALAELDRARLTGDYVAAVAAAENARGLAAQLGTRAQTRRAVHAGAAPDVPARQWFRQAMNLDVAETAGPLHTTRGFHYAVLALIAAFGASFVWIAWDRRRRVAALLAELATPAVQPGRVPSMPEDTREAPSPREAPAGTAEPSGEREAPAPATVVASSNWQGRLRVATIFDETPEVKTFRLMDPAGGELPFRHRPGQYLTLRLTINGKSVKRTYTIASSPTERHYVELTVKREPSGLVSRHLHDLVEAGHELEASGPGGVFTFDGNEAASIVLIGGGVGVTPLMSVVRYLTARAWPGHIALLFACRTTADFIFREELEYLQRRHPNLQVVATMTRGRGHSWMGAEGYPTAQRIIDAVPDIAQQRVHLCGPPPMMDAVLQMLAELGVPRAQIRLEKFGPDKRAASAPSPSADSATAATWPSLRFARSERAVRLAPEQTVLEAAEAADVAIDNSCRSGTCGSCKVMLQQGWVTMAVDDGLQRGEREAGWILACQARAQVDLVVDA